MAAVSDSLLEEPPKESYSENRKSNRFSLKEEPRCRQLQRLLFSCLTRWLGTLVIAVAIYIILWNYSSQKTMMERKKKEFNTLIVGASILLSLNVASSLKHLMAIMRWWVLSRRNWQPREVEIPNTICLCCCCIHLMQNFSRPILFSKAKIFPA